MSSLQSSLVQVHIITQVRQSINEETNDTVEVIQHTNSDLQHLILQRSTNEKIYPNLWQVVTGTIRKDETALQTALREIAEETGLDVDSIYVLPMISSFYSYHNDSIVHVPVFCAFTYSHNVTLSYEHQSFAWCSEQEAKEHLVIPAHRQGVELITQLWQSGFGKEEFDMIYKVK
jgi:8-oxo-dGTP pyrophosphatase MutT (NUDIX family)